MKRFSAILVIVIMTAATNFAISFASSSDHGQISSKAVNNMPTPPKPKAVNNMPTPPKPRAVNNMPTPPKP